VTAIPHRESCDSMTRKNGCRSSCLVQKDYTNPAAGALLCLAGSDMIMPTGRGLLQQSVGRGA
jgi:hypothetical protein